MTKSKFFVLCALFLLSVITIAASFLVRENSRLRNNNNALKGEVAMLVEYADSCSASSQVLQLRCSEYEEFRQQDAEKIRALGIKIKRLQSASKSVTRSVVTVKVPVRDTVIIRDTVRLFRWRDSWVSVEGLLRNDSVECKVHSIDTLRQTVYRVPKKFLFFRYGTAAIRQHIQSSNPHTTIVYSEQINLKR